MSQANYDERSEQNIASLQPDFAGRARQWLAEARKQGLNPLIHFAAGSIAKQKQLREAYLAGHAPLAAAPEHSYHCYGRAFDWVNIVDPDAGDRGLAWNDDKAYAKGAAIGAQFEIAGIGDRDNDHLQDGRYGIYADLPQSNDGNFPVQVA
jgi:hypothetical protein